MGKFRVDLLRREVKTHCGDAEESEADHLHAHTNQAQCLSQVEFFLPVRVGWIRTRDEDRGDKLEQESDDVEADEDESDESCCAEMWSALCSHSSPSRSPVVLLTRNPEKRDFPRRRRHHPEDDPREQHVDDTGHQNGGEDDETELDHVGLLLGRLPSGQDACDVSDHLHYTAKQDRLASQLDAAYTALGKLRPGEERTHLLWRGT